MGNAVYRVTIEMPFVEVSSYVVGEKEKDYFVKVFKERAKVEKIELDNLIKTNEEEA